MENKTDKPYSLQDALDQLSKKHGRDVAGNFSEEYYWETAELYASKATEELRKENERITAHFMSQEIEIERLKESNKELIVELDDNKAAADQAMRALERYGKGSQKKQENLDLTEVAECLYSISNPDSEVFQKSEGEIKK